MTETMSVSEAQRNWDPFLDRAEAGKVVVITRRGKPVAGLVPPAWTEAAEAAPRDG